MKVAMVMSAFVLAGASCTDAIASTRDFPISEFGAKPDGSRCTEAFAAAMSACEAAGGGRIVVPKGRWFSGAIRFRSNCELHLSEESEIVFSQDPNDYLPAVHTSWEGMECWNYCPLVYAYCCTNVAITGAGTLRAFKGEWKDTAWYPWVPQENGVGAARRQLYDWGATDHPVEDRQIWKMKDAHTRPHFVQFNRCRNVRWEGFKVRNSPFWTLHLYMCENAEVRGLDVYAHGGNNDGIDIEMSRNVLVENCTFDQGDDGVVIKSGRNRDAWRLNKPTENVLVRNCRIVDAHTIFGIGSEISGGVRNVRMENCIGDAVNRVVYIKTNHRRGGFVEDVSVENVSCKVARWSVFEIRTDVFYQWASFPDYETNVTRISNITARNIRVGETKDLVRIVGDVRRPPKSILVENVIADRTNGRKLSVAYADDFFMRNGPCLFLAGDSTLDDKGVSLGGNPRFPYASWGTALGDSMVEGCAVANYARGGESTKSFAKSGIWDRMISHVRAGDFVAIQFGHNDQKRSTEAYRTKRWADPKGLFREIVRGWVADVRARGATPILLSPICRGTFDKEGKRLVDHTHASDGVCLGSYRDAMRELSEELKCDYVDMNGLTHDLMERIGKDESMKFFVISTGLVKGKDGEPSRDTTHPVEAGAKAFARLFIEDVTNRKLSVAKMFKFKCEVK